MEMEICVRVVFPGRGSSKRFIFSELSFPGAGPQKGLFFPVSGGLQFAGAPAGLIGTWIHWKQEAPILVTEIISNKSPGTRAGKFHTT